MRTHLSQILTVIQKPFTILGAVLYMLMIFNCATSSRRPGWVGDQAFFLDSASIAVLVYDYEVVKTPGSPRPDYLNQHYENLRLNLAIFSAVDGQFKSSVHLYTGSDQAPVISEFFAYNPPWLATSDGTDSGVITYKVGGAARRVALEKHVVDNSNFSISEDGAMLVSDQNVLSAATGRIITTVPFRFYPLFIDALRNTVICLSRGSSELVSLNFSDSTPVSLGQLPFPTGNGISSQEQYVYALKVSNDTGATYVFYNPVLDSTKSGTSRTIMVPADQQHTGKAFEISGAEGAGYSNLDSFRNMSFVLTRKDGSKTFLKVHIPLF